MSVKATLRAALLLALVALGCSSLLDVEDYQSSPERLCELTSRCGGTGKNQCTLQVDAALQNADVATRSNWLAAFIDRRCGEGCTDARRCQDLKPLCRATGGECERTEDCCGFLKGQGDCTPGVGCCLPKGVRCESNEQCCDGQPCVAGASAEPTCGGFECLGPLEDCTEGPQCCTGICTGNRCAEEVCRGVGLECTAEECCLGLACLDGTCRVPVCLDPKAPCEPGGAIECCRKPCVPLLANPSVLGVCVAEDATCLELEYDCDPTDDPVLKCCLGTRCSGETLKCTGLCAVEGAYCARRSDCCDGTLLCDELTNRCVPCTQGYCKNDSDCCSNNCVKGTNTEGTCGPECVSEPGCTDPCTVSLLPLKVGNQACNQDPCVANVCAEDPYCCCTAWDAVCVERAKTPPSSCGCQ